MLIIYHVIILCVNNVLYVNKPSGISSFDVCYKLRKVLNTRKIGHTGTLDPLASGVMIILFDKATKANQFLVSDNKSYTCRVLLGVNTDTLDIDGNITEKKEYVVPDKNVLKEVLNSFLGTSIQEVPITSAISVDGKRLYEYQRQTIDVELPKREINVYSIELNDINEDGFTYSCTVSSGTYIRALSRDILNKLNLIGTVKELTRTAIDDIDISDCDKLQDILDGNYKTHNLFELLSKRFHTINYEDIDAIKNGKAIQLNSNEDRVLIVNNDEVLAIYEKNNDVYKCVRGLW